MPSIHDITPADNEELQTTCALLDRAVLLDQRRRTLDAEREPSYYEARPHHFGSLRELMDWHDTQSGRDARNEDRRQAISDITQEIRHLAAKLRDRQPALRAVDAWFRHRGYGIRLDADEDGPTMDIRPWPEVVAPASDKPNAYPPLAGSIEIL